MILDEIGKMECFSEKFKKAAIETLDATYMVIGTITLGGNDFIHGIKARKDIEIMEVTIDNRDRLPDILLERISYLYRITMA
ncbi:MAG: nucleoside-triphosphatase [bacterium]